MDQAVGQKKLPLWEFIPISRALVPILYVLLGLCNDLLSNFLKWVNERAEPLLSEEISSRNISMLAEIAVDEKETEVSIANGELKM